MNNRFMTKSPHINVMANAAYKAARSLRHDFREVEHLQVARKSLGDFVSKADKNSEKIIFEELSKARPDYSFLMEESGEVKRKSEHFRWIVDPLDGTTNFLHGLPHFAISIALEQDGHIVSGITYDPIKDEMFWAEKGMGAYVNQSRIRTSGRQSLDLALVGTGFPFCRTGKKESFVNKVKSAAPHVAAMRRMGSVALDLAYLACGRFDIYFETKGSPWDYATGVILIKEAGGFVSDHANGQDMLKNGDIFACNPHLKKDFIECIGGLE